MAKSNYNRSTTSSPPPQIITPTNATVSYTEPVINNSQAGAHIHVPKMASSSEHKRPAMITEVILVILQFIALIVIIVGFIPPILWQNTFLQVLGMLFIGTALFVAIWAFLSFKQTIRLVPSPNPNGFLVTGGPFGFIRHPMYFSLLIGSIGLTLAYPTIARILGCIVLVIILSVKIRLEERMLQKRFNGYEKYKQHTGALWPNFDIRKQGGSILNGKHNSSKVK